MAKQLNEEYLLYLNEEANHSCQGETSLSSQKHFLLVLIGNLFGSYAGYKQNEM